MADKQLIDATVTRARGMTLAGVHHEQGATVPMDEGHFADLGPAGLGWVDRAPAGTEGEVAAATDGEAAAASPADTVDETKPGKGAEKGKPAAPAA
jgi:hypothetical protein